MEFDENLNPINPAGHKPEPDWSKMPPPPDNRPTPPGATFNQPTPPPSVGGPAAHKELPRFTPPPVPPQPPRPPLGDLPPRRPAGSGMATMIATVVVLAVIAIVAIVMPRGGQTTVVPGNNDQVGITVTGQGTAYATPDVAKIEFGVTSESQNIADAQNQSSEQIASIKTQLARFKIDAADIKTIRYSVNPEYDYRTRVPRLRGYMAQHFLELTIRGLADVDPIVQVLGESGATNISQVRFTVDDPSEVQGEARAKAINEARAKAEQLADLSNAKLGKILSIDEATYTPEPYPRYYLDGIGGGGEVSTPAPGIEEGSISYASNITITYSLR